MTRPDRGAIVTAGSFALAAVVFALDGWPVPAALAAGCAIACAIVFWRPRDDIEALIKATREGMPEVIYVPAAWSGIDDTAPAREEPDQ